MRLAIARSVHAQRDSFPQDRRPDVLRWEEVRVGEPGPGEVRLRHVAVGLNFADTYFRTGLYPRAAFGHRHGGLGRRRGRRRRRDARAAGRPRRLHRQPARRVQHEPRDARRAAGEAPEQISFETAAAMMMRGLTSAYLMRRIYPWKKGDTFLVHAAAAAWASSSANGRRSSAST
jgi:NADPH2:quinone reductase